MATKIRLKRMGKKFYAFYRVVIMIPVPSVMAAPSKRSVPTIRTPTPSTIVIDSERAQYWLGVALSRPSRC